MAPTARYRYFNTMATIEGRMKLLFFYNDVTFHRNDC